MRFDAWEPLYLKILQDFGFSKELDEEAGRLLSDLLTSSKRGSLTKTSKLVHNQAVIVCGNSPSLAFELKAFLGSSSKNYVFIAADGATSVLLGAGVVPEIIVTDLDGKTDDILEANRQGSLVVVHAHGDNQDKLREYVPLLRNVIGTTQSRPPPGLYNFGGFTDGDRCVFLARYLRASEIKVIGFDFDDKSVTYRKRKKLVWARRMINLALYDEKSYLL